MISDNMDGLPPKEANYILKNIQTTCSVWPWVRFMDVCIGSDDFNFFELYWVQKYIESVSNLYTFFLVLSVTQR